MGCVGLPAVVHHSALGQYGGSTSSTGSREYTPQTKAIKRTLGYTSDADDDKLLPTDPENESDEEPPGKSKKNNNSNMEEQLGSRRSAKKKAKKDIKSPTGSNHTYNKHKQHKLILFYILQ